MNVFDKMISAVSPEWAVRRAAARRKLQIIDSGYGNYGASHTKDGLRGWIKQIEEAATAAERKRIQDIEDVALAGYEKIVNEAKFEKPVSAGDVATMIVAAQKKQGAAYIASRDANAQDSGAGNVGTGKHEGAAGDGGVNEIDAAIDRLFPETK